jgi:hypothetical protein
MELQSNTEEIFTEPQSIIMERFVHGTTKWKEIGMELESSTKQDEHIIIKYPKRY